jgi:hypothetical protein
MINFVDTEFVGLLKTSNFMFNKLTFSKNEFVELFKIKKLFCQILTLKKYLQVVRIVLIYFCYQSSHRRGDRILRINVAQ